MIVDNLEGAQVILIKDLPVAVKCSFKLCSDLGQWPFVFHTIPFYIGDREYFLYAYLKKEGLQILHNFC